MPKTQTTTMLQSRQESERERSSNPFNLRCLSLKQTTDPAGGGPLRLIGGATNEWLISRCAAPHAKHDTRCWFLSCCCWPGDLDQTADPARGGPLRLIGGATNEWLISRDAAPHVSLDTRCWFLDHDCIQNVAIRLVVLLMLSYTAGCSADASYFAETK
jgi:hypothetical protein